MKMRQLKHLPLSSLPANQSGMPQLVILAACRHRARWQVGGSLQRRPLASLIKLPSNAEPTVVDGTNEIIAKRCQISNNAQQNKLHKRR